MRRVKHRDTAPELLLRRALHSRGLRFRLHDRRLPGRPDIVLPKWRAVIFVHGCFWHGHDCKRGALPRSNLAFWSEKIANNIRRDTAQLDALRAGGRRIVIVWQCALLGKRRLGAPVVADRIYEWLRSDEQRLEMAEASTALSMDDTESPP
jgi:DNA mismatch endonuclease, patch repair protein